MSEMLLLNATNMIIHLMSISYRVVQKKSSIRVGRVQCRWMERCLKLKLLLVNGQKKYVLIYVQPWKHSAAVSLRQQPLASIFYCFSVKINLMSKY